MKFLYNILTWFTGICLTAFWIYVIFFSFPRITFSADTPTDKYTPTDYELARTAPTFAAPVTIHRSPHDADTVTDVTIHTFGIALEHVSIRAFGYDAWEVNFDRDSESAGTITIDETVKGRLARDQFIRYLLTFDKNGMTVFAEKRLFVEWTGKHDPYGRYSCWFWINESTDPANPSWINVAKWMRDNGHHRTVTPKLPQPVTTPP